MANYSDHSNRLLAAEKMSVGMFSDCDRGGMLHATLRRDRKEIASTFFHFCDHSQSVMFQGRAINDGVHHSEAAPSRRTDFHQSRIFKFTDHPRPNALGIEPSLQHHAHPHVLA